ncbi:hypothetical protein RSOLAG22IIIB_11647 [Rhizoctonia solani]|uniref:Ricin B lectin domain-containing protein n=1 Tax=Rhizoctonia solani TaxID=456999 RepID=A0A0K6GA02_9AGAM|nr:unnamed protein product [Rhizoctonia solani]CUA75316.1 hypothetical protein RSOLAG22IIIB_11647 [Rhizoctonia solani]
MSQLIPDGLYTIDKSAAGFQGNACMAISFPPGSTRLRTSRTSEAGEEMIKWEVKFDASEQAYTFRNPATGHFASFNGQPETNVQLYGRETPRFFQLIPSEEGINRLHILAKDSNANIDNSPLMSYPPLLTLQAADSPFTGGTRSNWQFIPTTV